MPQVSAGQKVTAAKLSQAYTLADSNSHTVTAAAYTDLSTVCTIPAGDPAAGMAYELACFGNGTQGSTVQTMQFGLNLGGSIVGIAPVIGTTAFSASLAFRWKMTLLLIPASTGVTATWEGSLEGTVTYSGGNVVPGNAANFTIPVAGGNSAPYTQDSTVSNDFSLWFQWGATTGSPTITCIATKFSRCG